VSSIPDLMQAMGRGARAAAQFLAGASAAQKNHALRTGATLLRSAGARILEANRADMQEAMVKQLSPALLDRLKLDAVRIEAMASGLEAIAQLADPIGKQLAAWTRPNGMRIERVCVPLGVIGIIYESRPNVTADAGALCLKSGNAVILRGGSESARSSAAIHQVLQQALGDSGLPTACIQMVPTSDRAAVGYMLAEMADSIDVIVPRGGSNASRTRRVFRSLVT
jgi:glutamate-5-semialdehyde dehydrogenase